MADSTQLSQQKIDPTRVTIFDPDPSLLHIKIIQDEMAILAGNHFYCILEATHRFFSTFSTVLTNKYIAIIKFESTNL